MADVRRYPSLIPPHQADLHFVHPRLHRQALAVIQETKKQSSHLSLHNSAPTSSSSLPGSDPAQRQVIQAAWIDAEGEIPVSRLLRYAKLSADIFQVLSTKTMSPGL